MASQTARGVTVSHQIFMLDQDPPPSVRSRSSLPRSAFHMLLNLRTKDNIWLGVCCWLNHVLFNLLTKGIVWHGSLADAIAPPLRPPRSVRHPVSELLLLPLSLGATCCLHWPLKLLPLRCWLRLLPLRRWLHRRRHCGQTSIAIIMG